MQITAIYAAAGSSSRLGRDKLFLSLGNKPLALWSLTALQKHPLINQIIIVTNKKNYKLWTEVIDQEQITKAKDKIILGGKERYLSVLNALNFINQQTTKPDIVLIQDAARPFLSRGLISDNILSATKHSATVTAISARDTIKKENNGFLMETIPRKELWQIQTPQTFAWQKIYNAFKRMPKNFEPTDDASLVEAQGEKIAIVKGHNHNLKVTTAEDLILAEAILKHKQKFTFSERAPAKINLFLDIIGKYKDGYHQLKMVNASVSLFDELSIYFSPYPEEKLHLFGDYDVPVGKENHIWKSINLFKNLLPENSGLEIELDKRIPVGAGLGGGTSDAAATIRILQKVATKKIPSEEIYKKVVNIGADIPYQLQGRLALVEGKGEKVQLLQEKPLQGYVILIHTGIESSTAEAYASYDNLTPLPKQNPEPLIKALLNNDLKTAGKFLYNALEPAVLPRFPQIELAKQALIQAGCYGAIMTGSGASVFGLVGSKSQAKRIKSKLSKDFSRIDIIKFLPTNKV